MKVPTSLQILSPMNHNIDFVENKSDKNMIRALIHFINGYRLSIIQGPFSYGGSERLFEIAIFNKNDDYCPHLFDFADSGDDVLGYLTESEVIYYINKIGSLKG